MKANLLTSTLLLFFAIAVHLPAQQADADRKLFEDTKAKAEKGDADAQLNIGDWYHLGVSRTKDDREAVKWWRKAAEQGSPRAQYNLGACYEFGDGVKKDETEAVRWKRMSAERGFIPAQCDLGTYYFHGKGVAQSKVEAARWFRKAAEAGYAKAQAAFGECLARGDGLDKDEVEAVSWYRKAAELGFSPAQYCLAACYSDGRGVAKDYVEGYKWIDLALAQGDQAARDNLPILEQRMTRDQIAEAQRLVREFKPRLNSDSATGGSPKTFLLPRASGTGFFITADGFLITNEHVVRDAAQFRLVTSAGLIAAKVVKLDAANDLALLKAEGRFEALPVASSRPVKLGGTVATVGFPNIGLQGFAPKLAKGEIASLSGASDDPRYFQISVSVQPGNSGGALVDEGGNVVGVVSAKLNAAAALAASGALPENVNYAVKSSFLLSFLEAVPEVSAKLKEPMSLQTASPKFEDVVKSAEQAAVLVLVY